MKARLIPVAAMLSTGLLLVGCSAAETEATPQEVKTVYVTPEPEPAFDDTPIIRDEDEFLYDVRSTGSVVIARQSDSELLDAGYTVCGVLDEGYTVSDVIVVLASNLPSDSEAEAYSALIAAALLNLCPQYQYQVD